MFNLNEQWPFLVQILLAEGIVLMVLQYKCKNALAAFFQLL